MQGNTTDASQPSQYERNPGAMLRWQICALLHRIAVTPATVAKRSTRCHSQTSGSIPPAWLRGRPPPERGSDGRRRHRHPRCQEPGSGRGRGWREPHARQRAAQQWCLKPKCIRAASRVVETVACLPTLSGRGHTRRAFRCAAPERAWPSVDPLANVDQMPTSDGAMRAQAQRLGLEPLLDAWSAESEPSAEAVPRFIATAYAILAREVDFFEAVAALKGTALTDLDRLAAVLHACARPESQADALDIATLRLAADTAVNDEFAARCYLALAALTPGQPMQLPRPTPSARAGTVRLHRCRGLLHRPGTQRGRAGALRQRGGPC